MQLRTERRDLLHQIVGELLAGDDGDARNVVDRLLGIKLGALPADLVENVDHMRLDVEKAELEHGEQAARPRTDDHNIGLVHLAGAAFLRGRLTHQHRLLSVPDGGDRLYTNKLTDVLAARNEARYALQPHEGSGPLPSPDYGRRKSAQAIFANSATRRRCS